MKNLMKQPIWVCWQYVSKGNKMTKVPFSASGLQTGTSIDHNSEWCTYEEARKGLADHKKFDGVGFVLPKGVFLLDIDHKDLDDPVVKDILGRFPTYAEISPSKNGIHIIGRTETLPEGYGKAYYQKNAKKGLELYVGGATNRFATYTGDKLPEVDERIQDVTGAVVPFLDEYMKKDTATVLMDEYEKLDRSKYMTFSEEDIPDIIEALCNQKNKKKFKELFYNGTIEPGKTQSEADCALCSLIAFRTGPDIDLIDAIFRQSALYREKWDREDYRTWTIKTGIGACKGVFHHSVFVRPSFVLVDDKDREWVSPTHLVEYAREHLDYIFVREEERGDVTKYLYDGGVYVPLTDTQFKGAMRKFIDEYDSHLVRAKTIDEAYKILSMDPGAVEKKDLNQDHDLINFQNGLLELDTLELKPHNPAVLSTIQLPCEWKGYASPTPVFDSFLSTLLDGDAGLIRLLEQWIGACLSNVPGYLMKKVLFLYGDGNTGKSQIKKLVEMILGDRNVTAVDIQDLENNRFAVSQLYGKRLAGASDMGFMTIREMKILKEASGGDAIFMEFKNKNGFSYVYQGLLWFCMNEKPKFGGDTGKWVFERIIPIHCTNVIPEEERDARILDKMYAERDGIVYKCLTAFQEVIRNGYRFLEPEGVREERSSYEVENDTALEFFEECMMPIPEGTSPSHPFTVTKLYSAYSIWYQKTYGKTFKRDKKSFYEAIASYLGMKYKDMVRQNKHGTVMKDYYPDPDAWDEYDLGFERPESYLPKGWKKAS